MTHSLFGRTKQHNGEVAVSRLGKPLGTRRSTADQHNILFSSIFICSLKLPFEAVLLPDKPGCQWLTLPDILLL